MEAHYNPADAFSEIDRLRAGIERIAELAADSAEMLVGQVGIVSGLNALLQPEENIWRRDGYHGDNFLPPSPITTPSVAAKTPITVNCETARRELNLIKDRSIQAFYPEDLPELKERLNDSIGEDLANRVWLPVCKNLHQIAIENQKGGDDK